MTVKLLITKWCIVELCFVGLGLLVDCLWTCLQPSYSLQSIDNMLHSVLYLSFWACKHIVNNYWCCPSPTVIETRVSVVPTGKLKSLLEEISWSHEFFFGVDLDGFVLFCMKALHHIKKCLNFHVLSEWGKIGQRSPMTWVVQRLLTQMKHLYTCLAEKCPFVISLLTEFSCWSFEVRCNG